MIFLENQVKINLCKNTFFPPLAYDSGAPCDEKHRNKNVWPKYLSTVHLVYLFIVFAYFISFILFIFKFVYYLFLLFLYFVS